MAQDSKTRVIHECGCDICRKFRETESPTDRSSYEFCNQKTLELHRAINCVLASADELNRRLVAGLISRLLGGSAPLGKAAIITGLSPHTIRRGWRELIGDPIDPPLVNVRRRGGGRRRKST